MIYYYRKKEVPMSVKRAKRFLNRVLVVTIIFSMFAVIFAAIEQRYHPYAEQIKTVTDWLGGTEKLLSSNEIMGISGGMLALTLIVCLFPLFMRRVNKKQYWTNTIRGVIASVVFFFTQIFYAKAEKLGQLHLIGAMVLAIVITLVIIEFLSLLTRNDEEVSFRTDLLAAAASGLASGIVIKLIGVVVTQIKL